MDHEPTYDSLARHERPRWYDDAKLGVFVHWGLYSVPAWAPRVDDIQSLLRTRGPAYVLSHNPYAEWYLNTMQIPGSPTARHHAETYGGAPYEAFVEPFDVRSADADLGALADLCVRAGARYAVLTTKHHDGFCLWPTDVVNPRHGRYHARRDLVGDFADATRARGMKAGLYYSGGYDWTHRPVVMDSVRGAVFAAPQDRSYADAVDRHLRELIERYQPSVLWNDIGTPPALDLPAVLAHYYNTVDDGVVNDRWAPLREPAGKLARGLVGVVADGVERGWRFLPDRFKQLPVTSARHYDFTTPEYRVPESATAEKWEATRGVGHSFGANHAETADDIISTTELVRLLVDVVAKNGNLLIGVGPDPAGHVPATQQAPLLGLGDWLQVHGDAVFGTRPWDVANATTSEGLPVRFTCRDDALFVHLLETPTTAEVELPAAAGVGVREVELLGVGPVPWRTEAGGRLVVTVPERLPVRPVHVVAVRPASAISRSTARP